MNMKAIYRYLMFFITILSCVSCNKEWEGEHYKKMISFAQNGVIDLHIRYKNDGKVTYNVPIVVSGSQKSSNNYLVKVGIDKDTLAVLNFERFRKRDDLYFTYLDEKFWNIPSYEVLIPSGKDIGLLPISFDLTGINMSQKWILPLTIVDDSGYETNHFKHFRKSLLNIIPYNDYSGSYGATAGYVYNKALGGLSDPNPQTVATRQLYVVDEQSAFFYAGLTEDELKERELYKINVSFYMNDHAEEDGSVRGTVLLEAPNKDKIKFISKPGTVKIKKEIDPVLTYLEYTLTTLTMEYEYSYLIPNTSATIDYIFKGDLIMKRTRNTTIPDEDQGMSW